MSNNWKKEVARDIIALGSIPFYFVVIIRAIIGRYAPFISQMVIALIVLVILASIFKKTDQYVARGLIIVVFSSIFYHAILYTIFASLLWLLIIISSIYLIRSKLKVKEIIKGVLFGIISIIVSYYLTPLILK